MGATFQRAEHIRRRAEFEQIYKKGARASGRFMTVFVWKTGDSRARLGIAATRKVGGAVVRNRAKRLVRELFRRRKPPAGLDVIVVPRREFLDASFDSLERELHDLLGRVRPSAGVRPQSAGTGRSERAAPDSRI